VGGGLGRVAVVVAEATADGDESPPELEATTR
jgi:hypothetical protein